MGLDQMIDRVKQTMQVLPPVMSNIVKYAVLTGMRPSESIESVKLLNRLPVKDGSTHIPVLTTTTQSRRRYDITFSQSFLVLL